MKRIDLLLLGMFGTLVLGMLFLLRIDEYHPSLSVDVLAIEGTVVEERVTEERPISKNPRRGSLIKTDIDSRILLSIDGVLLALDEATSVELTTLTNNLVEISISTGRVIVDSRSRPARDVIVGSSHIDSVTRNGATSFVNYHFDGRVSVIPLYGTTGIVMNETHGFLTESPVDILDQAPFIVTDTSFDPSTSIAEPFYTWFTAQTSVEIPESIPLSSAGDGDVLQTPL